MRLSKAIPLVALMTVLVIRPAFAATTPKSHRNADGQVACSSSGVTAQDARRAADICDVFAAKMRAGNFELITANSTLLKVFVSRDFFGAMEQDRVSGKQLMQSIVKGFQQAHGGSPAVVSVTMLVGTVKVMTGGVGWTGEIKAEYVE